jgi:hypothetical protein
MLCPWPSHLFAQAEDFLPPLILHEVQALDDPVETSPRLVTVAQSGRCKAMVFGEPTEGFIGVYRVYRCL